jgi:flagellar biosynthesis regulator FlaF
VTLPLLLLQKERKWHLIISIAMRILREREREREKKKNSYKMIAKVLTKQIFNLLLAGHRILVITW